MSQNGEKFVEEINAMEKSKVDKKKKIIQIGVIAIIVILLLSFLGDDSCIIETDAMNTGAVYDCSFSEAKEIVEDALYECYDVKLSLDEDFELTKNSDGIATTYIYVNDTLLEYSLGVEFSVYDDKINAVVFKTDTSMYNFDGLGVIQELYVEVVNEMTDDDIDIEEVKDIVRSGAVDTEYYRNDTLHFICGDAESVVYYYMFCACTGEYAQSRGAETF